MSCAHEPASLEDELMVGREALWREGDLEHCRHHLAGALAQAPDDPRCLELLAQWLAAGPDIDAVLARPQRWLGDVLVEAQACMHRGDAAAALPRMLAAIAHGGDPRLLGWLQDWTRSGRIRGALDGRELASQLLAIERSAQVTEELRCGVDDWLDLIDDQVDWRDMAITVRVRFKRQLRRGEPALALARALDERAPSLGSAAALAACHRDAGDHVAALAASLLGASRDPADGFPLLDAGDTALDQLDDWEQAIAAYAEAERRGAKPEWARVSRLAAEYLREPAAATRAAFEAEADAQPDSERARQLRDRLDEWIRYIRTPREACLNLLRTVNLEQESSLHISLNAPEAASATCCSRPARKPAWNCPWKPPMPRPTRARASPASPPSAGRARRWKRRRHARGERPGDNSRDSPIAISSRSPGCAKCARGRRSRRARWWR